MIRIIEEIGTRATELNLIGSRVLGEALSDLTSVSEFHVQTQDSASHRKLVASGACTDEGICSCYDHEELICWPCPEGNPN